MAISFPNIASDVRVPLFYADMDNSKASYFTQENRTLLIGHKLAGGTMALNSPILVSGSDQGIKFAGAGAMLARMIDVYRKNDAFGEVWMIAVDEPAGGALATGSIVVTGPASKAGTITLYIAKQKVAVGVAAADDATAIAAAIAAAVVAKTSLPVTASAAMGAVTLTCKWKGLTGNDITVFENYNGMAAGEETPSGVALAITPMANGTGVVDLAPVIAAMGDEQYDHIIHPFTDTGALALVTTEMNDVSGRWSWLRQLYGHAYSARRGTVGEHVTFGSLLNDQHLSVKAMENDVMSPPWEYAAGYFARVAASLNIDPARPVQTLQVIDVTPARPGNRFTMQERQTLLHNGMSTSYADGGAERVESCITTYQVNAYDQPDTSYLNIETLFTSTYVLRFLKQWITSKYGRHKLANNGTRFGAGQAIVTPNIIRGELIAAYGALERKGLVENSEEFAKHLIVERDVDDPNRLNVLFPPDYVNQLRVFALLNQFRLQYEQSA